MAKEVFRFWRRFRLYISSLLVLAGIVLTGGGCSGGGGLAEEQIKDEEIPQTRVFKVTDFTSPLYGTRVEIPYWLIDDNVHISITEELFPPQLNNSLLNLHGPSVHINSSGQTVFQRPIYVTLPGIDNHLNDHELPVALYYNNITEEWVVLPSFYNSSDNTIHFATNHLSLFGRGTMLMSKILYNIITDENNATYIALRELLDTISSAKNTIDCLQLQALNSAYKLNADKSWQIMERMVNHHQVDPCGSSWICGGKNFMTWLEEELEVAIALAATDLYFTAISLPLIATGAGIASGVLALIATPCLSCHILDSSFNPVFISALISYWHSQLSIELADILSGHLSCKKNKYNLEAYYKFDEYNIGDRTIKDHSGNNNFLRVNGTPLSSPGVAGWAILFDGSGDYLFANNGFKFDKFTITFWYKHLKRLYQNDDENGELLFHASGGYVVKIYNDYEITVIKPLHSDGLWHTLPLFSDEVNQWNFIAITYENGVFKCFKNLNESATLYLEEGALRKESRDYLMIGSYDNSHNTFFGLIDEFRIYSRVLDVDEIEDLFKYP